MVRRAVGSRRFADVDVRMLEEPELELDAEDPRDGRIDDTLGDQPPADRCPRPCCGNDD